jgi:hypothetical protein
LAISLSRSSATFWRKIRRPRAPTLPRTRGVRRRQIHGPQKLAHLAGPLKAGGSSLRRDSSACMAVC